MKRLDVCANSPNWYFKKNMDNSDENMHVDTGVKGLIAHNQKLLKP